MLCVAENNDYVDHVISGWRPIHPGTDLATYTVALRLMRIGRIVEALTAKVAQAHGLVSKGDFEVLSALRRSHPSPLRPNELADRLMVTTAGMTGRLDRLEKAAYIERRPLLADRRGVEVGITPSGMETCDFVLRQLAERYDVALQQPASSVVAHLSDDLRSIAISLGDTAPT
jgi:DNA-binding MarR family transcriptional regulator